MIILSIEDIINKSKEFHGDYDSVEDVLEFIKEYDIYEFNSFLYNIIFAFRDNDYYDQEVFLLLESNSKLYYVYDAWCQCCTDLVWDVRELDTNFDISKINNEHLKETLAEFLELEEWAWD